MEIMETPTPDTRGRMIKMTKDSPPGVSPALYQHSTSSVTQTDLDRRRDDKDLENNEDTNNIDNHDDSNNIDNHEDSILVDNHENGDENDKSEVTIVNKKSVSCVLI